jgi:hypothetical protein
VTAFKKQRRTLLFFATLGDVENGRYFFIFCAAIEAYEQQAAEMHQPSY